ncbi:MAG: flagellar biosynthetic protein FliO [Candidatus Caenarcaniphilales bacterium]|nr:flagellar biosynthetic protein FliO [Candidatus Caenarcaniphilales bacterium]
MKYILLFTFALLILPNFTVSQVSYANQNSSIESALRANNKPINSNDSLWIDESDELNYLSKENKINSISSSKPFTIIGLIIFSLVLVIGVMAWSVFTVNGKKKTYLTPRNLINKSNFKLLDSFNLDNGKSLYLVQLFEKKYVLASTWNSICFINEYTGEINLDSNEIKEVKYISSMSDLKKKASNSNLDFLTVEDINDSSPIEEGIKALIKSVSNKFSKKEDSKIIPTQEKPEEENTNQENFNIQSQKTEESQSTIPKEIENNGNKTDRKVEMPVSINNSTRNPSNLSYKAFESYKNIRKLKEERKKKFLNNKNQDSVRTNFPNLSTRNSMFQKPNSEILDLDKESIDNRDITPDHSNTNLDERKIDDISRLKEVSSLVQQSTNKKIRKKISIVED